jgi:TonB family protein
MFDSKTAVVALLVAACSTFARAQPTNFILATLTQGDTRYVFEIAPDRARALPQWDQRGSPEPQLTLNEARRLAETWLLAHNSEVKTLALTSEMLIRSGPTGVWHYRVAYDPIVSGRRLTGGPAFMAFVLLDRSVVGPRVESSQTTMTTTPAPVPAAPPPVSAAPLPSAAPPPPAPVARPPATTATATATAPTPALESKRAVYRPGNGVTAPRITQQVPPRYTDAAVAAKIEGTAVVDATVDTDGTVSDVTVVRSLDTAHGLDDEAVKAISQWKFAPGTRSGAPVPVRVTLQVEFSLGGSR